MVQKLREGPHRLWKRERIYVVFAVVGKVRCPFAQTRIQPLPQVLLFLDQGLVYTVPSQIDDSRLLVKPLCNLRHYCTPFALNSGDPGDIGAIGFPVGSFELDVIVVLLGFRLFGLVHDGDCPAGVQAAEVPGVGAALPDHLLGHEWFGFVERVAVAEGTIDC